jgi:hypothetical protein
MSRLVFAIVLSTFAWALGACSSVPDNARLGVLTPDPSQFPPVSNLLDHRCGSLDCHGNAQRNLIIYGCEGLRLETGDGGFIPGCKRMGAGGKDTTPFEFESTYRSLVGLEPAVMTEVMQGKGQHPELLTFVRKARGTEAHKGGALIVPGDAQDLCIASWLQGTTDTNTCTMATQLFP